MSVCKACCETHRSQHQHVVVQVLSTRSQNWITCIHMMTSKSMCMLRLWNKATSNTSMVPICINVLGSGAGNGLSSTIEALSLTGLPTVGWTTLDQYSQADILLETNAFTCRWSTVIIITIQEQFQFTAASATITNSYHHLPNDVVCLL